MVSPSELRKLQELAQAIWREAPRSLDSTMAELAYQGGIGASNVADTSTHRLWLEGDTCRAWAWHFPPAALEWAVHPASPSSSRSAPIPATGSAASDAPSSRSA
jgi:hypothetical protein